MENFKYLSKGLRGIIYAAGLYKTGLYLALPAFHMYHQLTTDTDKYVKGNRILQGTEGSYVAVTGCTDGIGKDLALEFSKRGYGLDMLARSPQKLENVAKQAKEYNPNREHFTKLIDFSKASREEYQNVFSEVPKGEVAILVNNVGMGLPRTTIFGASPQNIENIIKTNIFSQVMMTKKFLEEIKAHRQDKQSYIIHLASVVSDIRNPLTSAFYQATKTANKVFANYVHYPSSLPLDYLIIKPGWVSTNMTDKKAIDFITASVQEESQAIFNSIGYTNESYAQCKHILMMFALNMVPTPLYMAAFKYLKNKQTAEDTAQKKNN